MRRATIAGLMLLAAPSAVTMAETPTTAEPNAWILACRADNDLFQVLKTASAFCRRYDTSAEALRAAPRGAADLLPTDGHPAERTHLAEADFDLVMQMETSLWDLSAGSPIARHFENHRTIILPADATPAEAPRS